jgi:hypothetical protein
MSMEEQWAYLVFFGLVRLDISFPGIMAWLFWEVCYGPAAIKG